ncbi:high affinity copper uptake protein 1 isoform X2 [Exaiptasia diaphana]|uniref:Copper transport protein n=1 Tax=Exaiptasia diaphana TaxID=2652724 RepID=A0A913YDU2_EXADI|nr:high affinity copper uptake protein 1 isoform X2 [Exaiptasia diaphana]
MHEMSTPMPGMDHMKNGSNQMDHMSMMMYFHASQKVTILFKAWAVDSIGGLIGSCIAVFVLAALYEGLKVTREILKRKYGYVVSIDLDKSTHYAKNGTTGQSVTVTETAGQIPKSKICNGHHIIQSLLHIVQVVISYFLMLIFMTYNVWLCLAVALGAGFGYFAFGWKMVKVVDIYEHCH